MREPLIKLHSVLVDFEGLIWLPRAPDLLAREF